MAQRLVEKQLGQKKFQESRDRRLKQLTDDLGYINSDKISFIELLLRLQRRSD